MLWSNWPPTKKNRWKKNRNNINKWLVSISLSFSSISSSIPSSLSTSFHHFLPSPPPSPSLFSPSSPSSSYFFLYLSLFLSLLTALETTDAERSQRPPGQKVPLPVSDIKQPLVQYKYLNSNGWSCQHFPGGPVVKNLFSNAGVAALIPGQGTKTPHAVGQLNLWAATKIWLCQINIKKIRWTCHTAWRAVRQSLSSLLTMGSFSYTEC